MSRKTAREHSFRILFSGLFQHEKVERLIAAYFDNSDIGWPEDEKDLEFVRKVVLGVIQQEKNIDVLIEEALRSWKLNRLSKVDLTLLRLSAYEIAFMDDVPVQVSINEAVELAKKYSMDASPAFINGVLGSVAAKVCGTPAPEEPADEPADEPAENVDPAAPEEPASEPAAETAEPAETAEIAEAASAETAENAEAAEPAAEVAETASVEEKPAEDENGEAGI